MQKYVSIIDGKTLSVLLVSTLVTFFCLSNGYVSSVNITLFSLAVIFPLVFTIREAFKRRDNAIQLLSTFKASLSAAYFCFQSNRKLDSQSKQYIASQLEILSSNLLTALYSDKNRFDLVRARLDEIFLFVCERKDAFSAGTSIKLFRILKDAKESMENTIGLSTHGTPVSLRAYCLVFIYVFPCIFIPALVSQISTYAVWLIYVVAATPGFILVSLYNIQERMEDPFDQSGLDDIKMEEFCFRMPCKVDNDFGYAIQHEPELESYSQMPPARQLTSSDQQLTM